MLFGLREGMVEKITLNLKKIALDMLCQFFVTHLHSISKTIPIKYCYNILSK